MLFDLIERNTKMLLGFDDYEMCDTLALFCDA